MRSFRPARHLAAAAAMHAEMNAMPGMSHDGGRDMPADPHMFTTAMRAPAPGDSARALALVREIRRDLAKYRDVRVAEAAGFAPFLPNVPQRVYHYTNRTNAIEEVVRFDPAKPTSLWCLPPRGALARWTEQRDGKPVFGPKSPIATESACDAVGGRFVPHVFGWMVHANVFASDDPRLIWGHVD